MTSFIERILAIFRNLFKKDPVVVKVTLDELPRLIEKDFLIKRKELEEFCAKKIAEVKYYHNRAGGMLKEVQSKEVTMDNANLERFGRAAITAKRQIVLQLSKVLEKLDPKERGNTLQDARKYSGEGYAIIASEINSFRKSIAYTSFFLKDEMKVLGEALQSMLNIFHEVNTECAKSAELFEYEKVKEKIKSVERSKKATGSQGKENENLLSRIREKEIDLKKQQEKIADGESGKEMQELRKLEGEVKALADEKQELRTQISALLLNIDRPLARFKQLVDSGRWKLPKEEKEMLELFVTNPMLALKKDPKAEVFKKVLKEIKSAIEDGSIELKDKEKEKRLEGLEEIINYDFFGNVFWKMNELQKKQLDLNKAIEKNNAKKELTSAEGKLKEIENELNELKDMRESSEQKLELSSKEMEKEVGEIVDFAQKVLKKNIILEEEVY